MKTKPNEDNGLLYKTHSNPKPNGRPSIRTKEVEEAILSAIRAGKSLLKACEDPKLPTRDTVAKWLADDEARRASGGAQAGETLFLEEYRIATELRCDLLAEQVLKIADEANADNAQVARLQIDARRWYISKVSPKKYGDKANAEITVNNAINNLTISEAQKAEIQEARRIALEGMRGNGKELN